MPRLATSAVAQPGEAVQLDQPSVGDQVRTKREQVAIVLLALQLVRPCQDWRAVDAVTLHLFSQNFVGCQHSNNGRFDFAIIVAVVFQLFVLHRLVAKVATNKFY